MAEQELLHELGVHPTAVKARLVTAPDDKLTARATALEPADMSMKAAMSLPGYTLRLVMSLMAGVALRLR